MSATAPNSPPAIAGYTRRRPASRRRWFDWHSWLGVTTGMLLFAVCWSGAFATLAYEIDWLVNPAQRVSPAGAPHGLVDVAEVVALTMPEADVLSVSTPLYRNFAADVLVRTQYDQVRHVYVDPYSLEITGSTSFLNVQRYFRDFHRRFFGLGGIGFYLVCVLSLPLLASLVTGLVFYKRWWRRFLDFRLGRNVRGAMSNLHKLLGLWALWFVIVIAATGAWYLAERLRTQLVDGKFSYVDTSDSAIHPLPQLPDSNQQLEFGELLTIAQSAFPELEIRHVAPDRGGYFYAIGQTDALLVRDRANKVFLDPRDGRIAHVQRAEDLSTYWRWSDMADPLHFGDFGGLASKLIWFAAGLVLAGLCLSGTWVHVNRLQRGAGRRTGRAHAIGAAIASGTILVISVPLPAFYLDEYGPIVGGAAQPARLPSGATAFLVTWGAVTVAGGVIWAWRLLRPGAQRRVGKRTAQ